MNLFLREIELKDKDEILEFVNEVNNSDDYKKFEGLGDLKDVTDGNYEDFLKKLEQNKHLKTYKPHLVNQTTYVLVDDSGHIYGAINIRHELTEDLLRHGGNIGYLVRPTERGHGYAKLMLRLALEKCRELGMARVLVTCREENKVSANVIEANGGVYEDSSHVDGETFRRYWVGLQRKLVCIGGGEIPRIVNGVKMPYETREIDEEIVRVSGEKNPKLLFIGTASRHSLEYFSVIKEVFGDLGCAVSNLDLRADDIDMADVRAAILGADIIYVGGGDTRYMLERWRELGVDKLLVEAYEKGVVCSGLSAGSYCWFKYNYDLLEGLGVIDAINCVHYDKKDDETKMRFCEVVKDKRLLGYALENCTALEIVDGKIRVIKSDPSKNAYRLYYDGTKVIEEVID